MVVSKTKKITQYISKTTTLFFVVVFLSFSFSKVASAATYYVATTGKDSNPGTEGQPWQTIQKAADTMVAGDTIRIHAGTYAEEVSPVNSGEAGNYITYEAYGDGEVIIKPPADTAYKTCIILRSWIRFEYLKFINLTLDNSQHVSAGQSISSDTAAFSCGEYSDARHPEYLNKPHTNIIIENCKIMNSFAGIYFYYKAKDIQIKNCTLEANQYGIQIIDYVENVLIENNDIKNGQRYSPADDAGDNMRIVAFNQRYNKNITIRNNEVSDSLRQGILFTGTDNGLIENNHCFNNGATGIQIEGADDGRMMKNAIVRNNICENNARRYGAETGIWVDDASYVVVENNVMRYNATGLRITGSDQVIARNNQIYENHFYGGSDKCNGTETIGWTSAGIWTWGNATTSDGGRDHIIVHNTIYKNGNNNPCNNAAFAQVTLNYGSTVDHINLQKSVFKNNISSMGLSDNPKIDLEVEGSGQVIDFNNYYTDRQGGFLIRFINNAFPYPGKSMDMHNYQANSGYDKNSIISDPLFVNQNTYDFNLSLASPAIDKGDFLTKTTNAGNNSKNIQVADARYFTDGYGLVDGDEIKIGSNSPVKISSVDYASNTIALVDNLSWNIGDNVSYAYSGAKPDMGALEYEKDFLQSICIPGDANGDKSINISDVQTCINVILGTDTTHKTCSDMNGDSNVNITDCQAIINKILNP